MRGMVETGRGASSPLLPMRCTARPLTWPQPLGRRGQGSLAQSAPTACKGVGEEMAPAAKSLHTRKLAHTHEHTHTHTHKHITVSTVPSRLQALHCTVCHARGPGTLKPVEVKHCKRQAPRQQRAPQRRNGKTWRPSWRSSLSRRGSSPRSHCWGFRLIGEGEGGNMR